MKMCYLGAPFFMFRLNFNRCSKDNHPYTNKEYMNFQNNNGSSKKSKTKQAHTKQTNQNKQKQSVRHKTKKDSGKQTPEKKCCASMVYRNGTRKATTETDAILEKL
jgi:hypothetical protein